MEINTQFMPMRSCFLINENNGAVPRKGPCFDKKKWENLKLKDQKTINAYLDSNARKNSVLADHWEKIKNTRDAKEIKSELKLATHGSRTLFLADKYSGHEVAPMLVRNLTATVAGVKAIENKCKLVKWTAQELEEFKDNGLQEHQKSLSNILSKNSSIRVVNISLGYKKSWIQEDNPACSKNQVNKEYQVLRDSWRNLLGKHNGILFVVAAGNEGEDFSKEGLRNNDLWASLSDESNLILVASTDGSGKRASFSNYGIKGMYWAPGRNIPIIHPHPTIAEGYVSGAHGTSSSAPVVSGKILKAILEGVKIGDLQKSVSTGPK